MRFFAIFLIVLVCAASFSEAGKRRWGGWGGGKWGGVQHHHYGYHYPMYSRPVYYPVYRERVVPVSHPVYIPVPIPVGGGGGGGDRDEVIVINAGDD